MDGSWWPAIAAVVAVAVVAGGYRRWRRRAGRGPAGGPQPGEIWWADVPFEDRPGSKDRPCLVLSVRRGAARVVKITSRHGDGRPGVIALPGGAVGDRRGRASYLETDEVREVPLGDFRRRGGAMDPALWGRVRRMAR